MAIIQSIFQYQTESNPVSIKSVWEGVWSRKARSTENGGVVQHHSGLSVVHAGNLLTDVEVPRFFTALFTSVVWQGVDNIR